MITEETKSKFKARAHVAKDKLNAAAKDTVTGVEWWSAVFWIGVIFGIIALWPIITEIVHVIWAIISFLFTFAIGGTIVVVLILCVLFGITKLGNNIFK